jgi:hypothetical protein
MTTTSPEPSFITLFPTNRTALWNTDLSTDVGEYEITVTGTVRTAIPTGNPTYTITYLLIVLYPCNITIETIAITTSTSYTA